MQTTDTSSTKQQHKWLIRVEDEGFFFLKKSRITMSSVPESLDSWTQLAGGVGGGCFQRWLGYLVVGDN